MPLHIAIGADHGGFALKGEIIARIAPEYTLIDVGAHTLQPADDYPEIARAAALEVVSGKAAKAILICGSGVGACIAANKVPGIRACLCHDIYSAHQGVEHDDMNVLCLGARVIGVELAVDLIKAFLAARFSRATKYRRRLAAVLAIEAEFAKPQ